MTEAHDPLQPGFARLIHPITGGIADVGEDATGLYFAAGWVPLDESNMPPPPETEAEPAAMTEAQARDQRAGTGESADTTTTGGRTRRGTSKE